MALISWNQPLKNDFYLMKIAGCYSAEMGQFFMLRKDSQHMFLGRPMSVYDIEQDGILFLYRVTGQGTICLSNSKKGDTISIHGPYGQGFPKHVQGNIALVGGGTGIAPLFYCLKQLREIAAVQKIDVYLGLNKKNTFESYFKPKTDHLFLNYGGFITDHIRYTDYQYILSCGPEIMMKKIEKKARQYQIEHFVSLEKRMACGVGACLACTCQTKQGNKRVCKEGPVFKGRDIFYAGTP